MTHAWLGSELPRGGNREWCSQQAWPLPTVPPPAPHCLTAKSLQQPPLPQPRADLEHKDLCSFSLKSKIFLKFQESILQY